jgi:hypothetical protein
MSCKNIIQKMNTTSKMLVSPPEKESLKCMFMLRAVSGERQSEDTGGNRTRQSASLPASGTRLPESCVYKRPVKEKQFIVL